MNISIRNHVINNFKECSISEIEQSITSSIGDKEELTLPGLGVFFEVLWENSDDTAREKYLKILNDYLSKKNAN